MTKALVAVSVLALVFAFFETANLFFLGFVFVVLFFGLEAIRDDTERRERDEELAETNRAMQARVRDRLAAAPWRIR